MTEPNTILAIVQARMGATRLPGKVLADIGGQPMLIRVVERLRRAQKLHEVVVATTRAVQDDPLAEVCRGRGYPIYRGEMHDVLDRFYQTARSFHATVVVRITADDPVIDPQLVDLTVSEFQQSAADFAANRLPPPWHRTYPNGLDVEVCSWAALERAWREAREPFQREHVMPFFYEGLPIESTHVTKSITAVSPRGFRLRLVNHDPDYGDLRWAVDTPEDLDLIRRIYAAFGNRDDFTWEQVLALFKSQPELVKINAAVKQKRVEEAEPAHPDS
ncbi:MAG: glycosyltransferase family protein [Anaerolineales bacterium]|jgi:spore coat polysaccharide biosynthesis protein SpsF